MGASLAVIGEPRYPPALAQVDAPPPLLYVKGRLELAEMPIVAIVGARNGSAVGQKFTRTLATELGDEGFVIASGLARGIDTAAHLAALELGTIAVLAAASTMSTRRKRRAASSDRRARPSHQRASAKLLAARQGLPAPQPPHLRDLAWRGGGQGRRALRIADHGAVCRGARPRGVCRAGQPARSGGRPEPTIRNTVNLVSLRLF